jgi:hypothetical protein
MSSVSAIVMFPKTPQLTFGGVECILCLFDLLPCDDNFLGGEVGAMNVCIFLVYVFQFHPTVNVQFTNINGLFIVSATTFTFDTDTGFDRVTDT